MKEFGASIDIPESRMTGLVLQTEEIRLQNFTKNEIRRAGHNSDDYELITEREPHLFGMTLRIRAKPLNPEAIA